MNHTLYIAAVLLYISTLNHLKGQTTAAMPEVSEEVQLFTDRSIYATDEEIQLRANYSSESGLENKAWSTVLYVELIKPDGFPVIQEKFPLSISGSNARIKLPGNLSSGQYFLKGYTKWMRNTCANGYAYHPIIVVNPNSNKQISQGVKCPQVGTNVMNSSTLKLSLQDSVYGKRKNVQVNLNGLPSHPSSPFTISVIRKGTSAELNTLTTAIEHQKVVDSTHRYLPEVNGTVLSGTVIRSDTRQGAENISLHLTLMNGVPFFSATVSDKDGRFYFTLPRLYGSNDFYITADEKDVKLRIDLDPEFCSNPVPVCGDKDEFINNDEAIRNVMINAQITSRFKIEKPTQKTYISNKLSFYGTPKRTINTKKYIDLPYIEEFISELVPEFSIIHRKGEAIVKTRQQNTFSPFPVLLLIDNIPVYDVNTFLKIRTNKIEQIDIIDEPYIVGNFKYNGIIHAKTAKHDFAGIDLPESSMFFSYQFPGDLKEQSNTKQPAGNTRLPDRRNCLYWNPEFYSGSDSNTFSFNTSDVPGTYQVIVRYIDSENHVISTVTEFRVE